MCSLQDCAVPGPAPEDSDPLPFVLAGMRVEAIGRGQLGSAPVGSLHIFLFFDREYFNFFLTEGLFGYSS